MQFLWCLYWRQPLKTVVETVKMKESFRNILALDRVDGHKQTKQQQFRWSWRQNLKSGRISLRIWRRLSVGLGNVLANHPLPQEGENTALSMLIIVRAWKCDLNSGFSWMVKGIYQGAL